MIVSARVECEYRVFARQLEDANLRIDDARNLLRERVPSLVFKAVTETYWPIAPEDLESTRDRGLLIVESDGKPHVVVRELAAVYTATDLDDARQTRAKIDALGVPLTSMRVIDEISSEFQAV